MKLLRKQLLLDPSLHNVTPPKQLEQRDVNMNSVPVYRVIQGHAHSEGSLKRKQSDITQDSFFLNVQSIRVHLHQSDAQQCQHKLLPTLSWPYKQCCRNGSNNMDDLTYVQFVDARV